VGKRTLQCVFRFIDRKKVQACVEHEFATLDRRLDLKNAIEKEIIKRLVGRPKKELQALLQMVVKAKALFTKKAQVRSNYIDKFLLFL